MIDVHKFKIESKSNPIKFLRKLMSNSKVFKNFLKQSLIDNHYDWEKTIQEKSEIFIFSNLEFLRENQNWLHIVISDTGKIEILQSENDLYKIFNDNFWIDTILSIDDSKFILLNKNKKHNQFDEQYYYENKKSERLNKCIEKQLFSIIFDCCKLLNNYHSVVDLTYETVYVKLITDCIQKLINTKYFKNWLYPITRFKLKNIDFEIDYRCKRTYIENRLEYTYIKDNQEITYKYGNIIPTFTHFRKIIYTDNVYENYLATVIDSMLQIFNGFSKAFKDYNIQLIINNICLKGFSPEYNKQFRTYLK